MEVLMGKRVKIYPPKIEITEITEPEKKPRINYRVASPSETKLPSSYRRMRGELLRGIRRLVPEIEGINTLSIADLNDIREGIRRCDMFRIVAQYK